MASTESTEKKPSDIPDEHSQTESRPSYDGSGAALHKQPAALAPTPQTSTEAASSSAPAAEGKAMADLTEFSVMSPEKISKFPMP